MTRTLPKALLLSSSKKLVIRHKTIPSRANPEKWAGTEKQWFYCYRNISIDNSIIGTWRHATELRNLISDPMEARRKFEKIEKIYNIRDERIELVELTEDLEQEILFWKLKGISS